MIVILRGAPAPSPRPAIVPPAAAAVIDLVQPPRRFCLVPLFLALGEKITYGCNDDELQPDLVV
uniref:hypothetical protein n=1 Tax=Acidocella sp. C78 TaxID=1671486 RepID=UPI00191BC212|nr:hypothetical protein [Acidocella sp. C78]